MSRILITGVTGKSGLYFLKRLSQDVSFCDKNEFTFIIHSESKIDTVRDYNISSTCVTGDLEDAEFLKKLFSENQFDVLLHIAGPRLTPLLAKTAINCGTKRLILVHTTGIYSKYKRAAQIYVKKEKELRDMLCGKNIALTILRPTMIYGDLNDRNISKFITMVDKLRIFPVVDHAKYELQPVHAKDLGDAYYSVLTHPEETSNKEYNLSGGAPIKLIDMLLVIGGYLNKRNTFISVPFWLAYSIAFVLWCLTFGAIDYREKVQRLVEPRVFSYDDAQRDFGYSPVSFQQGVKDEVQMYIDRQTAGKVYTV